MVLAGGQAVVVDASRHLDVYETFLRERGAALVRVLDTHVHADHLSGARSSPVARACRTTWRPAPASRSARR